ncbi:hypothetical protein F443_18462 [Phytophthora nicotianae P1569]|uniref:Uncharacterized protein n=1 Tax=Phytophthora nicotianae P1569 TaxID=1317065 RepID=V9E7S9_PHYNI|nr:hypothetical protein F443_18462 [Phytophthora nicotianae P1569]
MAAKNCMAMTDDGSIISECITQGGYDWRPRMWPQTPITPLTPLEVDVVLRGQEGRAATTGDRECGRKHQSRRCRLLKLTLFYEAKKDGNKVIELTSRRCAWAPSSA